MDFGPDFRNFRSDLKRLWPYFRDYTGFKDFKTHFRDFLLRISGKYFRHFTLAFGDFRDFRTYEHRTSEVLYPSTRHVIKLSVLLLGGSDSPTSGIKCFVTAERSIKKARN